MDDFKYKISKEVLDSLTMEDLWKSPNLRKYVKKQKLIPKKLKEFFINSIIFENENFIILDKWSGIATQGGSGINISIDNIIKNISSSYNLVHRLDKETSGLLIIAKNIEYTKIFGQMFKKHEI